MTMVPGFACEYSRAWPRQACLGVRSLGSTHTWLILQLNDCYIVIQLLVFIESALLLYLESSIYNYMSMDCILVFYVYTRFMEIWDNLRWCIDLVHAVFMISRYSHAVKMMFPCPAREAWVLPVLWNSLRIT